MHAYICVYISIYLSIYLSISLSLSIYIYIHMYTCIYAYRYTCIYAYMYICIYVCVYVCVCIYIYNIHTHIHKYICLRPGLNSASFARIWGASGSWRTGESLFLSLFFRYALFLFGGQGSPYPSYRCLQNKRPSEKVLIAMMMTMVIMAVEMMLGEATAGAMTPVFAKSTPAQKPYAATLKPLSPKVQNVDEVNNWSGSACKINTRFRKTSSALSFHLWLHSDHCEPV